MYFQLQAVFLEPKAGYTEGKNVINVYEKILSENTMRIRNQFKIIIETCDTLKKNSIRVFYPIQSVKYFAERGDVPRLHFCENIRQSPRRSKNITLKNHQWSEVNV